MVPLGCSITDWIQAGAVVAGVVIAWQGLLTWRSELRGRAVLDLLEAAIRLRDTLQASRRTCTFGGPGRGCTLAEARASVREIDDAIRDNMAKVEAARARPEALFGRAEIHPLIDPVFRLAGRVRAAVEDHLLQRAKDAVLSPRNEEWHRLATWVSEDPAMDRGTAEVMGSLTTLEQWAARRLRTRGIVGS
jgi:hypothetical protein